MCNIFTSSKNNCIFLLFDFYPFVTVPKHGTKTYFIFVRSSTIVVEWKAEGNKTTIVFPFAENRNFHPTSNIEVINFIVNPWLWNFGSDLIWFILLIYGSHSSYCQTKWKTSCCHGDQKTGEEWDRRLGTSWSLIKIEYGFLIWSCTMSPDPITISCREELIRRRYILMETTFGTAGTLLFVRTHFMKTIRLIFASIWRGNWRTGEDSNHWIVGNEAAFTEKHSNA